MPTVLRPKKYLQNKRTKLPIQEQHKFLSQLHRLLENGYTLTNALEVIQWDHRWVEKASSISNTLKQGKPLNQALFQANFDEKIVSFMYFAMAHGDLKTSLKQCCLMLQQQLDFIKKFKQSTRYPLVLFLLFIILLYFVKNSVYPSFIQLFSSTGQSSLFNKISISIIDILFNGIFVGSIIVIGFFLYWMVKKDKLDAEEQINIYKKIPIIRTFQRLNTTFLFSIHLSSLLYAGISLKQSLHILKANPNIPIISFYSDLLINELQKGHPLTSALPSCYLLENELSSIFQKNSNNDDLVVDLTMYAEFLMNYMEEKMKKIISLIQPIFFIVMAALIIFIYLSLMLPMFQLIQNI
ncbi:competence type IV pilus assembly protein ComGB [Aquibacillus rhizosphaerae]|uniref:Competence type IV pilus assembly protein ComGB n=1 Tax=Aquibacillus rhizosphaerae TaxID=3051431 RepID=A0ABT7L6R5_9BACI|nr:competence type IV pilus assembly protein ComGB [Aquibacillus sp. LR5S19]MDL4841559.1 competence type IV pilus assembly protein ComGB [Aquibacillus sp. LR5S19]